MNLPIETKEIIATMLMNIGEFSTLSAESFKTYMTILKTQKNFALHHAKPLTNSERHAELDASILKFYERARTIAVTNKNKNIAILLTEIYDLYQTQPEKKVSSTAQTLQEISPQKQALRALQTLREKIHRHVGERNFQTEFMYSEMITRLIRSLDIFIRDKFIYDEFKSDYQGIERESFSKFRDDFFSESGATMTYLSYAYKDIFPTFKLFVGIFDEIKRYQSETNKDQDAIPNFHEQRLAILLNYLEKIIHKTENSDGLAKINMFITQFDPTMEPVANSRKPSPMTQSMIINDFVKIASPKPKPRLTQSTPNLPPKPASEDVIGNMLDGAVIKATNAVDTAKKAAGNAFSAITHFFSSPKQQRTSIGIGGSYLQRLGKVG